MSKYSEGKYADAWIVYKNVPYSKGLERFIEKHMGKWINVHKHERDDMPHASYRIVFEKEGNGSLVDCRIELQIHEERWVGYEAAHSADLALLKSLQRMAFAGDVRPHGSWVELSRAS
jgi:hypothetical protein